MQYFKGTSKEEGTSIILYAQCWNTCLPLLFQIVCYYFYIISHIAGDCKVITSLQTIPRKYIFYVLT
jgi:hypothetical protein